MTLPWRKTPSARRSVMALGEKVAEKKRLRIWLRMEKRLLRLRHTNVECEGRAACGRCKCKTSQTLGSAEAAANARFCPPFSFERKSVAPSRSCLSWQKMVAATCHVGMAQVVQEIACSTGSFGHSRVRADDVELYLVIHHGAGSRGYASCYMTRHNTMGTNNDVITRD